MNRFRSTVALFLLTFAGSAAAQTPFGGLMDLCQASPVDTGQYSCWYSEVKKKCVCDPKPLAGAPSSGTTTPTKGGINTQPANPALRFDKAEGESLLFSPKAWSKDVLSKGAVSKKASPQ